MPGRTRLPTLRSAVSPALTVALPGVVPIVCGRGQQPAQEGDGGHPRRCGRREAIPWQPIRKGPSGVAVVSAPPFSSRRKAPRAAGDRGRSPRPAVLRTSALAACCTAISRGAARTPRTNSLSKSWQTRYHSHADAERLTMAYRGRVKKDGSIVLDPGVDLPDGAEVRVELEPTRESHAGSSADPLAKMTDLAVETRIPDLVANVDHPKPAMPAEADPQPRMTHIATRSTECSLEAKVTKWLLREGYPLEYTTANSFHRAGFSVHQGIHVRTSTEEKPREIDVVASADHRDDENLIRVEYIAECKWSRDRPWVVFTSRFGHMGSAACINQTIASDLGRAALWLEAGDRRLSRLEVFATPACPGFGGRQAFSDSRDVFYGTVQSLVGACYARMESHNDHRLEGVSLPESAVVAFPLIVIDRSLFEACAQGLDSDLAVRSVDSARLHWRGSAASHHIVTFDVVTLAGLGSYIEQRAAEVTIVLATLKRAIGRIRKFAESGERSDLRVTSGSRGTLGPPSLIARLIRAHREAKTAAGKHLRPQ